MKKRIVTLFALVLIAGTALSCASIDLNNLAVPSGNLSQFGSLLIELETSVYFNYQTPQWRARRNGWISDVRTAYSLDRMKNLLIEFETNVNYSAQVNNWRNRRDNWLRGVRGAYSVHDLARYMIECETSILFDAQAPSWRSQRSGWLSRSRSL